MYMIIGISMGIPNFFWVYMWKSIICSNFSLFFNINPQIEYPILAFSFILQSKLSKYSCIVLPTSTTTLCAALLCALFSRYLIYALATVSCHCLIKTSSTLSWIVSTSGIFLPDFFSTNFTTALEISLIFEKSFPQTASTADFMAFCILRISKSTIVQFFSLLWI